VFLISVGMLALMLGILSMGVWRHDVGAKAHDELFANSILPIIDVSTELAVVAVDLQSQGLLLRSVASPDALKLQQVAIEQMLAKGKNIFTDWQRLDKNQAASLNMDVFVELEERAKALVAAKASEFSYSTQISQLSLSLTNNVQKLEKDIRARVVLLTDRMLTGLDSAHP
jgi:hypothetical protein